MFSQYAPSPSNSYDLSPLQSILKFCFMRKQHTTVLRVVLDHYRGNDQVQQLISVAVARPLLFKLCARVTDLSDADLWQLVAIDYDALFRVKTKPFWFAGFLREAVAARRFSIVRRLLDSRERTTIPRVPLNYGLFVMQTCLAHRKMDLVLDVFEEMDLEREDDQDQAAQACFLAVRALHALGKTTGDVAVMHAKYQHIFARAEHDMPDHVRRILQESGC